MQLINVLIDPINRFYLHEFGNNGNKVHIQYVDMLKQKMIKDQKDQTSKIKDKKIKDQKMMVKYIESTKASLDKRI